MIHSIRRTQLLKSDLHTVWNFISSPSNLSRITPKNMEFEVLTEEKDLEKMYPGLIIEYHVKPLMGLKMHWVTEISHVEELKYFVDEQRFGPYSFWHHKHFLREVKEGVEMTDIVHYKLPFGFLGNIVNSFFVKQKLKQIFDYRVKALDNLFNSHL
jgi:ligand-binding SRPBCC domain-containing protein